MKIDQMLLRENFYSINERTLQEYYKVVHNIDVNVTTQDFSLQSRISVFPKINAIISTFPSKKVINYIFTEFNIRNNITKFIISKVYTFLSLFTGGIMAEKKLEFTPKNPIGRNILIWPCNRKFRIFDFKENYVDSIVKEGFTKKYFDNEVRFRISSNYDFVPSITDYGVNWYRELILDGQALARVKNVEQYKKSRNEVIGYLKIMVDDSLKYVEATSYSKELVNRISYLSKIAKEKKHIKNGNVIIDTAIKASKIINESIEIIPVALSHGDLQDGNIWFDNKNNRTLILDWETNDYRSIWYDPSVLILSTRRHGAVYNMFTHIDNNKSAILINDKKTDYNMKGVFAVYLLEDIIFYLEDNLELPSDWGHEIIDAFGEQLKKLEWN